MNIPFINFTEQAQIPLSPAYILKIKECLDESRSIRPQIVINLSETIVAKIYTTYSTENVQIFEAAPSPNGFMYKFGKVDSYTTESLQTGSCFTDVFQGKFKTYALKEGKAILVEESEYVLGHLNGDHKYYLDDVIETTTYVNDIKEGPYNIVSKSGVKILEGAYRNDQRDGIWNLYYANGNLKKMVPYSYVVGGEYGITKEFNEDGSLKSSYGKILDLYHGPLVNGSVVTYYLFGTLVEKEEYDKYDFKKQDELFSNVNRYFLGEEAK